MNVLLYTLPDCPSCKRIEGYYQHKKATIVFRDINEMENITDKEERRQARADLAYQNDRAPLVYQDGEYQELDDLERKVNALETAQRQGDLRIKDFIL